MKQVLFLFLTLFFTLVKADNTNNTVIEDTQRCIEVNKHNANNRNYYSFMVPAKHACESYGYTVNLCDPIIPEIVEITNVPTIGINSKIEVTFIGDDDSSDKILTQNLLDSVKGPTQYFIVPEEFHNLAYHIKIKFLANSEICEQSEKFEKLIVQVFGVKKVIQLDDDDISEELEQYCYNNFMVVPFNVYMTETKMKKTILDDLTRLEKNDNDIVSKLLSASFISDKGDPDKDLCRGYLYLKSMNDCNKVRLEEVKGSKPLSKEITGVLSIGDKAPKFIKDCIREFTVKPAEKPDYSKAKTVEEGDWFVKMEL